MKMKTIIEEGCEVVISEREVRRLVKLEYLYYCYECRCYHLNGWLEIIQHKGLVDGEQLFWSNRDGWGSFESATVFTQQEKEKLNLPVGGEWADLMK